MLRTLQGFKDFIMRGNVVDLAVGIVIGAAFTTVVTAFTGSFIKPLLQVFGASTQITTGGTQTKPGGTFDFHGQTFDYAGFANAVITFVLTAAVLYFLVVLPMNTINERRNRGKVIVKEVSDEVALLREIRDALVGRDPAHAAPTQAGPGHHADVH
jgi:large conductance mechanosensitive channel